MAWYVELPVIAQVVFARVDHVGLVTRASRRALVAPKLIKVVSRMRIVRAQPVRLLKFVTVIVRSIFNATAQVVVTTPRT
jgi:hypothetical protein